MELIIRNASTYDASVISELSTQLGYIVNVSDTTQYIECLSKSNMDTVVVATIENVVVGWMHILYAVRVETAPFCEIAGLVVDENYRGRGIGKMLISYARQWCAGMNCDKLRVRTNMIRTNTHHFYLSAGFVLTKEQKIFDLKIQ